MDGYIQTGLGILVSLILFVIGYRQTIGAKKERAKNASNSIHRAIMRRMVLEDYAPVYKDLTRIIEGKAREFKISSNDLLSEEQVLNSLYTEVFDSDLISPSQRIEIEQRLGSAFAKIEQKPSKPSLKDYQRLNLERASKKESVNAMVLSASLLGALSSILFKFYQTKTLEMEWLFCGLGVLIGSIAVLTALIFYRKTKEKEISPSRGTARIVSTALESDIAKILKKNKFDFVIEPNIGGLRPDFLVSLNGKNIAIEVKAWRGPVPLHLLRRTIDYLQKLVHSEKIDQAFLVTQKKESIPTGSLESNHISVVSINELANKLKKAA